MYLNWKKKVAKKGKDGIKLPKIPAQGAQAQATSPNKVTSAAAPVKSGSSAGTPATANIQPNGTGIRSISLKGLARSVQSTSDSRATTTQKVAEVQDVIDPSWNDPVTQQKVDELWQKYAASIQRSNPRLHSIFTNHQPKLKGEHDLILFVKNQTQVVEIQKERVNFLNAMKRRLRNAQLQLIVEVSAEASDGKQKAYTAADKFKLMVEKNPLLVELKKQFGLDLE